MAAFIPRKEAIALIHEACGKNLRGNSDLSYALIPLLLEKSPGARRSKAEGILRSREGKSGDGVSPIQVRGSNSKSTNHGVNMYCWRYCGGGDYGAQYLVGCVGRGGSISKYCTCWG